MARISAGPGTAATAAEAQKVDTLGRRIDREAKSSSVSFQATVAVYGGRERLGQPPPENDVLWAVVRRADGYSHSRAIELAQSDRCHGLCNSAEAATAMKGSHYDEG